MNAVVLILCLSALAIADEKTIQPLSQGPDGKVLNIFQVVRFPNEACTTSNDDMGVCYTSNECTARGGSNKGTCASGFGVCCSFSVACGGISSQNNTYFASDGSETSPCTAKICKMQDNICQLRLDFDTFNIAQPNSDTPIDTVPSIRTQCTNAQFTASSNDKMTPVICGYNNGQHIYVEADDACNTLNFVWATTTDTREWRIRVSQILCGDPNKPPEGCLQYFTGTTGTIKSFNFDKGIHLADQNYVSCIRAEQGYCTVEFTPNDFRISASEAHTTQDHYQGDECSRDYVYIPHARGDNTFDRVDRYCGRFLSRAGTNVNTNGVVTLDVTPFQVGFVSDGGELSIAASAETTNQDALDVGYSLAYKQTTDCSVGTIKTVSA